MEIKKTRDGRSVTIKNGNIYVADKCMGHNIDKIPPHIKTDAIKRMQDAYYACGALLLTKNEGDIAQKVITDYWEAERLKERQERLDLEASLQKYRMLIKSGHYYTDEHIDTVCLQPDSEQIKYAEWLRGNAVMTSIDSKGVAVKINDSPTAQTITSTKPSRFHYGSSESAMWVITPDQEFAIVSECIAAKNDRDSKKMAAEAAEKDRRAAIFAEAAATGKKQVLDSWVTDECTENLSECSFDAATLWALPDGTTKTTYSHCH